MKDIKITMHRIDEFKTDGHNPNSMTEESFRALVKNIHRYGFLVPVITNKDMVIADGEHRLRAAKELELEAVPAVVLDIEEVDRRILRQVMNKLKGSHDEKADIAEYQLIHADDGLSLLKELLGTDEELLKGLMNEPAGLTDPDEVPAVAPAVCQLGELWALGDHRLLCGDSTKPESFQKIMGEEKSPLLHADPPYGMGKQKEGVLNDNLYNEKLDEFQLNWWKAAEPYLLENASAYIWGTAEDLWRFWFNGGLKERGDLNVRNEIVWDKGSGMGMNAKAHHMYATSTERCLFLMKGPQFLGNQNKEDYYEGYEPIRQYLVEQRDLMGWEPRDINQITETQMAGHWFTKSQFAIISKKNYDLLAEKAAGKAFNKTHEELVSLLDNEGRSGHRATLQEAIKEKRSYFNNTHEVMRDVWPYPRVIGEERQGHATPKPVEMMTRAIKSSSTEGDVIIEPFGGSGSTLIACEKTGRACRIIELDPNYCDVIIKRWEDYTGQKARRITEK